VDLNCPRKKMRGIPLFLRNMTIFLTDCPLCETLELSLQTS
jgi:hypothetical protein